MINAKDMKELKDIAKEDEIMESAITLMEDFLNDEEMQDEFDKITDIEYYAKLEEKKKTAKNMLKKGYPIEEISSLTNLTVQEIKNIN